MSLFKTKWKSFTLVTPNPMESRDEAWSYINEMIDKKKLNPVKDFWIIMAILGVMRHPGLKYPGHYRIWWRIEGKYSRTVVRKIDDLFAI